MGVAVKILRHLPLNSLTFSITVSSPAESLGMEPVSFIDSCNLPGTDAINRSHATVVRHKPGETGNPVPVSSSRLTL